MKTLFKTLSFLRDAAVVAVLTAVVAPAGILVGSLVVNVATALNVPALGVMLFLPVCAATGTFLGWVLGPLAVDLVSREDL